MFSEQLSYKSWITSYKRLVSTSSIASLRRRIILFALFEKSVDKMERFSIFFGLCSLAILVGSSPTDSSTETTRSNGYVIGKPHADILESKSVKNDSESSLVNQSDMKGAAQIGERSALHLNEIPNASTIPTVSFLDDCTKGARCIKRIENREDDASPSNHKNRSNGDLSSHDIFPDIILARLTRQVERSNVDSSNPSSVENISAESVVESENIGSSQERSNFKSDLGVAEDRYRFQYPYWYRGQFANQRYRANDRREPYRSYLKYPVFPGK